MTHRITGIILCGGMSSRMGTDKGLVKFNGHEMVKYSIQVFEELGYHIVLSTNNPEYARFGYPIINDKYKACGPLGGLHAALDYSDTLWNAVIPCDLPLMESIVYQSLYDALENAPAYTTICNKKQHPLVGFYKKEMVVDIARNLEERQFKMLNFLANNGAEEVNIGTDFEYSFTNFNTSNDIAEWKSK